MLPASTSPSAPAAVILDITSDNWTQFNKAFTLSCYTKFGVAGQQILSNREIPLTPFAVAPTKQDVDATLAGVPIPGQFTYARRAQQQLKLLSRVSTSPQSLLTNQQTVSIVMTSNFTLQQLASLLKKIPIASTICIDTFHYHLIRP